MSSTRHRFVADKLWLLIAIVTFALMLAFDAAGIEFLEDATMIVGWFLLTPIFLFFGGEIAELAFEPREESADSTATATGDEDALDLLKRRYAAGELSDAEFERRLDRLIELDRVDASGADLDVLLDERAAGGAPRSEGSGEATGRELEREGKRG